MNMNVHEMIHALKQCAIEHKDETVPTFHIRTSDLCRDVAKYLEEMESSWKTGVPEEHGLYVVSFKEKPTGFPTPMKIHKYRTATWENGEFTIMDGHFPREIENLNMIEAWKRIL